MARGKSKDPKTWEQILMVLVNGGVITKEQIEQAIGYKHMYRISTELWKIKTRNGVIKTIKDGRKTVGYELVNVTEMMKLLSNRGFSPIMLVDGTQRKAAVDQATAAPVASSTKKSKKKIEKLADLNPEKVNSPEVDVVEITEEV
jgi:hypothetical protein